MRARKIDNGSQLADKAGLDRSVVSQWLNDKASPTLASLDKLKAVLGRPKLELMVAAGLISLEDARMKELPNPPEPVATDEVEEEIRSGGYPPEVEKMLLKMRQDNREQIRATVAALRAAGALEDKPAKS